ncbi:hypothetical protein GCM10012289_76960 [Nonomuraea cavernae]|uniref:Uncharacterized protein n=1 Tax=Nonomuraea cavernae TaxID=2045107 RepID=A0A918DVA5_9ACTN|nr:hypothetical protein GCM10012289_76960 [Nonomuraea cavernae]
MSPPNEKSGSRATGNRPNTQQGVNDTLKVQPTPDARHANRQTSLPIVPALAFPPAPGLKQGLLLVESCPRCGWWHRHTSGWPTNKLLSKRGKCGQAYELVPYVRRKRGRRAA